MSDIQVRHDNSKTAGSFILRRDEKDIGRLDYVWDDEKTLRATHTFIPSEYRGQKLGDHLFDALMDFVNEHDLQLVPECPYIELKLRRMKSQEDRNDHK